MSYDITIFFSDNVENVGIDDVASTLNDILGLQLNQSDDSSRFESRVLGLEFELTTRKGFLRDEDDMEFSKYSYQLEITSRLAGGDIIHPIGYMIAETLSVNFSNSVMLCLSSVEFLGAIFEKGFACKNNMSDLGMFYKGTPWVYSSGK